MIFWRYRARHERAAFGVPEVGLYDVRRDPGERYGALCAGQFGFAQMQRFLGSHMAVTKKSRTVTRLSPASARMR